MTAYYNENDPHAAAWLRELINHGHVAKGVVDERSIEDVTPRDLRGFKQHHFFAGIGGWSYALRLAGWPDGRQVWTGSCPCQPFSAAGKGGGFADERHLWPAWYHLIAQCRPGVVFGEQVASVLAWLDLVQDDLEAAGYAFGASDISAAGIGAHHIRQRLYFVAYAKGVQYYGRGETRHGGRQFTDGSELVHADGFGPQARGAATQETGHRGAVEPAGRMEHTEGERWEQWGAKPSGWGTLSAWCNADWLLCQDGKHRPVEPGTRPLAHGVPARVGRLRGYGNAIVPQVAAVFVQAYLDAALDIRRGVAHSSTRGRR